MSLPKVAEKRKKSTNPKCAKVGCITSPCEHKRPPVTEDGFCVDFNDGVVKSGIPQIEKPKQSRFHNYVKCSKCGRSMAKDRTLPDCWVILIYGNKSCEHDFKKVEKGEAIPRELGDTWIK